MRILRNAGHNVVAIIEDNPGIDDATILAQAVAEGRIILTFDSDYGNLIFRDGLPAAAVIYLRYEPLSPQEPAFHVLRLLTIEEWRCRIDLRSWIGSAHDNGHYHDYVENKKSADRR